MRNFNERNKARKREERRLCVHVWSEHRIIDQEKEEARNGTLCAPFVFVLLRMALIMSNLLANTFRVLVPYFLRIAFALGGARKHFN